MSVIVVALLTDTDAFTEISIFDNKLSTLRVSLGQYVVDSRQFAMLAVVFSLSG